MQKRCVTSALRTVNTTDGKDIVKMTLSPSLELSPFLNTSCILFKSSSFLKLFVFVISFSLSL